MWGLSSSSSTSGHIIIETGWGTADSNVTRGANSFIYGVQRGQQNDDTLSINANVTINNLDSTSSGDLTVRGDLYVDGTTDIVGLNTSSINVFDGLFKWNN